MTHEIFGTAMRTMRVPMVLVTAVVLSSVAFLPADTGRAAENTTKPNAVSNSEPAPRAAAGQSVTRLSDGRWLLVGGKSGTTVSDAVVVQSSGSQTPVTMSLRYPRAGHTATVLPDGTVAVVGGVGPNGAVVSQAEILDVARGESRVALDSGLAPRSSHSATLLTDGRVLLAGGRADSGASRADAQLWDPQTGRVESVNGTLSGARDALNATLLADGSVLIRSGSAADRFDAQSGALVHLSESEVIALASVTPRSAGVAAVLPVADASDAPVDTRVAIRLSQPIDPRAIADGSVTVVGPAGAAAGSLVVAEGGRLLFFTPAADLLPNASYTVFVKGPVPLAMSTFTTRALPADSPARAVTSQSGEGNLSLEITNADAKATARTAKASQGEKPAQKRKDAKKAAPDEEEDDDEIEDWRPGPEHRHGNWRVIGLRTEPHTKRPIPASAELAAAKRVTAVTGRVVRLNGRPIAGVPVRIGNIAAQTDEHGRFLLRGVPDGRQVLFVDGASVQRGGRAYLSHYVRVEVEKSKTTRLADPIYLAREDREHAVSFPSPTDREVVVTHPTMPGLELHIPKGAVLRTPDGKIVNKLSITPLPVNRAPFPVPMGFPVYFAISPAGVFVDNSGGSDVRGIRVLYPNFIDAPPGTRVVFWNYDPNGEGWQVYGGGTVSEDGLKVVPDEGVKQATLMAFGYGLENRNADPSEGPPPGSCVTAGDPVDCATGLFLHQSVDLFLKDTMPVTLTRTYRQNDSISRDFGVGSNHSFGMFLSNPTSDTAAPAMIDLILSNGGRIRFRKIAGTTVETVVFEHSATPTTFQGARLQVNTTALAWELTLRDKTVLQFQRHTPNRLIGIRNRFGSSIEITRTNDLISQIVSPHRRTMTFSYDNAKRITQIIDNSGRAVRYQYDSTGRLWKVTDPAGKIEQYGYDSAGRMTTVTDRRGNIMVTNVYDGNGRVQQQTLADGAIWQLAYQLDANGKVAQTDITNPRGFIRRAKFNSSGYITEQIWALGEPEQRTTLYAREPVTNLVLSTTDQLGRVTRYSHNSRGQRTGLTRMFGTASAVTGSYEYDPRTGLIVAYTDPLNYRADLGYDSQGNLVSIIDPLNRSISFQYDDEGNPTSITDPLGRTSRFEYNLGDLEATTTPAGRTSRYFTDNLGRQTGVQDPAGRSMRFSYDVLDRVLESTDAAGQTSVSTYDENGNLRTFTDPRNAAAHTFAYDARNRLHIYTDPLNASEVYGYDGMGNLTSKTDRKGQVTSLTYDALDRLRSITFADSSVSVTWEDANRRVTIADSANGTIVQTYDDLGRLVRESGPEGQLDYQYDAASRRTSMTIAGVSTPITYQYDAGSRLTQVAQGGVAVGLEYDAGNRRTTTTLPNGIVSTWSYDVDDLIGISFDKDSLHLGDIAYGHDDAGRTSGMSGNLTKLLMPAAVSSATYDAANRLSNWGGTALTYDGNGNLISQGSTTYSWNARNELTATSEGTSSFGYDALGRRRSRSVSGLSTPYLHDGLNPVKVSDDIMLAGSGLDEFYAEISAGGVESLLRDSVGSTVAVADSSAAVTAAYAFEAYGQATKTGAADARFQFTGRERDLPGLQFNRARYYSPDLGRFISEDPIGLGGGLNSYTYAGGNPVSGSDPLGLYCTSAGGTTTCSYPGGPRFELPRPPGFPSTIDASYKLYHHYDVQRPIGCASPQDVMQGLINNPTPGKPSPATPGGTFNDARVVPVWPNPVTSYLTTDLNTGSPLVVNITGPKSAFGPGYVARLVQDGVAHTYGEGLSPLQSPAKTAQWIQDVGNWYVWGWQMDDLIEQAHCGCR